MTLQKGQVFVIDGQEYIVESDPEYAIQYSDGQFKDTVVFVKLLEKCKHYDREEINLNLGQKPVVRCKACGRIVVDKK